MMLRRYDISTERWFEETIDALAGKTLGPRGRRLLTSARDVRSADSPYILVNGNALYPMYGSFFHTGRRSDPLAAEGLDYYRKPSRSAGEEWWRAFHDAQHKGKLSLRFTLGYAPDDEWWGDSLSWDAPDLAAAGYVDARPELVVLFGASDVDVPTMKDETRHQRLQRGLRAHGLRIAKDRIELVAVSEPEVRTGYSVARDRLSFEVLDSDEGKIADGAHVQLTIDGRVVKAKVGDLSVDATLKEVPSGFVGYAFVGPGHLAVIKPVIKP
jgi:hypothetical protein